MKYLLIALIFLTQANCAQEIRHDKLDTTGSSFRQHAFLLEKSIKYNEMNNDFKYSIQKFIDTCTEYNFSFEKRINPLKKNTVKPILLLPYLFNNNYTKVILLILTREKDLQEKSVDYVHFVFGETKTGKWSFKLKERYVRSFSYENNYPLLSDTEISLNIVREFVDMGYMNLSDLKINDHFFKNEDW